jgi:hypothetical protein
MNKTIYDFVNDNALKSNDEIPFWRILPDGSGQSTRVSFSEFIASLPSTQNETPTELTASTGSTSLNFKDKKYYIVTLGAPTAISTIKTSGKSFNAGEEIIMVFVSTETRAVTFGTEFNLPTSMPVTGKMAVRFKAISETEAVLIGAAGGGGGSKTRKIIPVRGTNWGGWTSGQDIPVGMDYDDILLKALSISNPPVYNAPSASLSVTGSLFSVEAGANIDLLQGATFNKNDAGSSTGCTFYKGGVALNAVPTVVEPYSYNEAAYQMGDGAIEYSAMITYGVGPIKNNTLGTPDSTGQIAAGSVSTAITTIRGFRNVFYGFNQATLNSATIRGLANNFLNPYKGQKFNINITPAVTEIVIAIPLLDYNGSQLIPHSVDGGTGVRTINGTVTSIEFKEGAMFDVKGVFSVTKVSVEGANGYAAKDYAVLYYKPVAGFGGNYTYIVTI